MRRRLAEAPVGRLATADGARKPHAVPVCFALSGDVAYFAVDSKPKRTRGLKRLRNIAVNPQVSILVDHYDEDWSRLWWVRADGTARIVADPAESSRAIDLLVDRHPQYRQARPEGPVVAISIAHLSGWSAS